MDKRAWKLEVQLSKSLEAAEKIIEQYNKTAEQLQLIPNTRGANGFNFELHMNPNAAKDGQSLVSVDLRNDLLPALRNLKDVMNNQVHETNNIALGHKETLNKVIEDIGDKNQSIRELDAKLESLKLKYQQQKSVWVGV